MEFIFIPYSASFPQIPLFWHHGRKYLQGKVSGFALKSKSSAINENEFRTLWTWFGKKANTKREFVTLIVSKDVWEVVWAT